MYSADFMFKVPYFQGRWNEHKDVKEDKEREPFYFGGKKPETASAGAASSTVASLFGAKKDLQKAFRPKKSAALTALTAFGGLSSGD